MTRITQQLHRNVFSVIRDILEMDRFREPGQEEVELFLKSAGTHGSILDGDPLYRECALPGLQIQEAILFDFEEELEEPVRKPTKANP